MNFRTLREHLGPLWWYAALMFAVSRMGDVVNMAIGLWLVPRFVSPQELGALLPVMNFSSVYALPLSVLLLPAPKFLNVFASRGEGGKARTLLRDVMLATGIYTLLMVVFIFWTGDAVLLRLKLADRRMLWPVAGFAMVTVIAPVLAAAQQAFKLFRSTLVAGCALPYVRLAGMLACLPLLGGLGYLLAQFGMGVAGLMIAGGAVWLTLRKMERRESYRVHWREMMWYALPLVLITVAGRLQMTVEGMAVRQRLPEEVSAGYFFVTMFGAIPTYFIGAVTPFLWVLISDKFERGERTEGLMWQSLAFNFTVGGMVTAMTAFVAPLVFNLPGDWPWKPYAAYANYVWVMCLLNVIRSGLMMFTTHETACRRFGFMWYTVPASLACCALLYVLPGWAFFRPWLPRTFWAWADARIHFSLNVFLGVMLATSLAALAGMAWQLRRRARQR